MGDFKVNYRFNVLIPLVLAAVMVAIPAVCAWDFSDNEISTNNYMDITTTNGGSYYVGFRCEGAGLNALHITKSISAPYGQVSTVSSDSGTFYLADTGGRGYFDKVILMVAIKAPDSGEELSEDLKINIKASGYRWTSSGVKDQPPDVADIVYVRNSIDRSFGLYSITYGLQSWKPAGEADHPIMYGQSSSDEFYLFFVDTGVGVLGGNSEISGLADNGMARIDYSIENYNGETIVFNVYGYALNADAVQDGIAWTNKIEGTTTDKNARTSPSGYIVLLDSTGSSDDEFSDSDAINYGDGGSVSYSESDKWTPSVGNLNITSEPTGAEVFIDGVDSGKTTNATFVDLPAGDYAVRLELHNYNSVVSDEIQVKKGYVTTRHFNLTPASGRCTILSDVKGARIFIDGEETLCYANWTFTDIITGNHTVSLKTTDERIFSKNISIDQDKETIVFFNVSSVAESEGRGTTDSSGEALEDTVDEIPGIQSAQTGSVYITSYPSEMSIYIDGVDSDYTTPHLIYGLKGGYHKIGLKKQDLFSESKEVFISSGEMVTTHFNLIDVDDSTVSISVESRAIRDGSFAVNGELPYFTVPSKVKAESFGSYITYNDGENYYSKTLPVLSGGESFVLEKTDNIGSLSVASDPKDAEIYIDGLSTGYRTPYTMNNIGSGYHRLKVVKEGYIPVEKEIWFVSDDDAVDLSQHFILEEISTGNLTITSIPEGCMIYLRSFYTGQTTPYTFENIPIGTYDVGVMFNRTVFKDKEVTVLAYEKYGDTTVDFELDNTTI